MISGEAHIKTEDRNKRTDTKRAQLIRVPRPIVCAFTGTPGDRNEERPIRDFLSI